MEDQGFDRFLLWEQTTRDTIDFKTIYVDMAGDLIAGLMLSQIVYWHLPKKGKTKLRVRKDGHLWIAKGRAEWYDEIRVTAKQVDRALGILEKKGIIVTALYKFNGAPTKHIRIDHDGFLSAWNTVLQERGKSILPKGENPPAPKGKMDVPETGNSLTETTTETTAEQETADADFWGPEGKPKREQEAEPLPQTDDPLVLAGECARRNGGKKSYTVPAEAGGADVFEDKPLRGFCALAGVQPGDLPKKKRRTWTRQLSGIAEEWEATPDLLYQAIRALPDSPDYGWVHPTSPYQSSFKEAIGVLITRIKANGGNGNAQKPPKVVIFPEPDYLMIPGQPHVTKGDLRAAFEKKRLEREKALAEMTASS